MRRKVFVAVVLFGVCAEACFVGRDLTYVDPSEQAISEGQPAPGAEAGAPGADQGAGGDQGVGGDGTGGSDAGGATHDGGQDSGTTKPPAGCPAGSTVEVEPNDQSTQASKMSQNENCGSLVVGSDEDFWMFVVGKQGFIDIKFDADVDAMVGIIDLDDPADDGDSLPRGHGITISGATPGDRYYLKVFSPGTKPQGYTINLDNE